MPHNPDDMGSAREWIRRARSNLVRAKQPKSEEVFWEDLCFDAQQAVEKALKALIIDRRIPFRLVHDIAELLTLLERDGVRVPGEVRAAVDLTPYAVESRYPGPAEPVTEEEFRQAVATAETVVAWAASQIRMT